MKRKPRKILLAHNYYSTKNPSGENAVFDQEKQLLMQHGHLLETLTSKSDALHEATRPTLFKVGLLAPYNITIGLRIERIINGFNPDLLHVHNTFPMISPAIFRMVGDRCPKVMTLHNYRLICPSATLFRNERPCFDCVSPLGPLPGIVHGCYRKSRLATASVAATVFLHQLLGTWKRYVDAFIVLSEYQKEMFVSAGLPKHKIHVKPNSCADIVISSVRHERRPVCIYVGRLSQEKGLQTLIEAWRQWGTNAPTLKIIGDGDLREELQRLAKDLNVQFMGILGPEQVKEEMSAASLLILPSMGLEAFGLVVIEAMRLGTPVMVSDLGPLPDLVDHGDSGLIFQAGNSSDLISVLRDAWRNPETLRQLGEKGKIAFENRFTREKNYEMLMEIYDRAYFEFSNSLDGRK